MNGGDKKNEEKYLVPEPQEKNSLLKEAFIFLWEIVKVVVISLAVILPIRYYLVQPFYVKGASMEPNFYDHEYLMVDQISYRFHEPSRGDVVVFRYPGDPSQFFIKRIIGLPNEIVRMREGKILIFNAAHPDGVEVSESYLPKEIKNLGNSSVTLGKDEYFVMGDNREESMDSRAFGPVRKKAIMGRVFFRGWPLNEITIFSEPPQYGI